MPRITFLTPLLCASRILYGLAWAGFALAIVAWIFPASLVVQAKQIQSVPLTLGVTLRQPLTWQHGNLVRFLTPDLSPYYPADSLLLKEVAAVPGDRLIRLGRDFYVNGHYVATARSTDSRGRPAPLYTPPHIAIAQSIAPPFGEPVCREVTATQVPPRTLFVLGSHERSYDSRYWGVVPLSQVTARVVKIF